LPTGPPALRGSLSRPANAIARRHWQAFSPCLTFSGSNRAFLVSDENTFLGCKRHINAFADKSYYTQIDFVTRLTRYDTKRTHSHFEFQDTNKKFMQQMGATRRI
jgi:hypothetical protein